MLGIETDEFNFQVVKKTEGLTFINDSRAINLNRLWFSLERLDEVKNVILIIGNDIEDFSVIRKLVEKKVNIIISWGSPNDKLNSQLGKLVSMIIVEESLESCIKLGTQLIQKGETLLFSPGCDNSYGTWQDRGETFNYLLNKIYAEKF